jgi:hypothetical protein
LENLILDAQRGGATQSNNSSKKTFGQIYLLIWEDFTLQAMQKKGVNFCFNSYNQKNVNTGLTHKQ